MGDWDHDDWIDATVVDSAYEQQTSVSTRRWRHRWKSTTRFEFQGESLALQYEWMPGPAPDMTKRPTPPNPEEGET